MNQKSNTIFGIYPIQEAISSNIVIDKLFIQKDNTNPKIESITKLLELSDTTITYVPSEKLNRLTRGNHQGIVAVSSPISFSSLEDVVEKSLSQDKTPLFLVLDQISDVRNFGAIIRTAECTGVNGIVIQNQGSAPLNADAIKTSAGAAFKVPICRVNHLKDAMFLLQASDIKLVAATEKTDGTIYDVDFKQPTAIIMGSEHRGVNPSILKMVDAKAKLPLLGEIESLNVSVACGAFLYEAIRQRMSL